MVGWGLFTASRGSLMFQCLQGGGGGDLMKARSGKGQVQH